MQLKIFNTVVRYLSQIFNRRYIFESFSLSNCDFWSYLVPVSSFVNFVFANVGLREIESHSFSMKKLLKTFFAKGICTVHMQRFSFHSPTEYLGFVIFQLAIFKNIMCIERFKSVSILSKNIYSIESGTFFFL